MTTACTAHQREATTARNALSAPLEGERERWGEQALAMRAGPKAAAQAPEFVDNTPWRLTGSKRLQTAASMRRPATRRASHHSSQHGASSLSASGRAKALIKRLAMQRVGP
jgi:hypothetical protein